MNEDQKPRFDPYASWGDQPPETPVTGTPMPEEAAPEASTPETATEALVPEEGAGTPPVSPNPYGYGTSWGEMPPEPEGNPGRKRDFFFSLIGTILGGIVLGLFGGYPIFLVGGLGIVLRFVLQKQNRALARGFMWGGVVCIAVPLIVLALVFGSCLLMLLGSM